MKTNLSLVLAAPVRSVVSFSAERAFGILPDTSELGRNLKRTS